ncbi:MAG: polyphosphate kinase 1 [Sporomusaceae bacterium]|jgi:polyphosphate kinase|nr:polyphosphate kinase 1 [Sporomusaceae bacterium]
MLNSPENFFNRELSWLKFNKRVLGEANVKETPLLERLKFIAIASSNLDEFFMIRVAGLKQQQGSGINKTDNTGRTVSEQLDDIAKDTHALVQAQYSYLKKLLAEMEKEGIYFKKAAELDTGAQKWAAEYFQAAIAPVITPLAIDARQEIPFFANRTLNLAIILKKTGPKKSVFFNGLSSRKDGSYLVVIQVPKVLPRIIEVPAPADTRCFIFLEDLIESYCAAFFHGYQIKTVSPFRITRNSDLDIAEEDAEDLLKEVEKSLRQRAKGNAVRLEIGKNPDKILLEVMKENLAIHNNDIYEIPGILDTTCFFRFAEEKGFANLCHQPFLPQTPQDLTGAEEDIFALIRKKNLLLHHPYESFDPVVDFLTQAANDADVLAIKQTLYRVGTNSPIVRALAAAAENSKQVTVLVELKARFDEENNIAWAKELEEAGCHVIYGLIGLKTHSKITLVVRREPKGINRYVHLSTGNYNGATAKVYTDLGFFTANAEFGADASAFFNVLSGYSDPPVWQKLTLAPIELRAKFKELIKRETALAQNGKPGRIIAKMNSLVDEEIILKLYEASCAGVKIDLIVRGMCSLRPGVSGVSENISVRSIIGQFLEHHRIFYFGGGEPAAEKIFLSSADWMTRNFDDRVELLFPIEEAGQMERIKAILAKMLADNQKSYLMQADGNYHRVKKTGKIINSQQYFYSQAQELANPRGEPSPKIFQPSYNKQNGKYF